MSDRFFRLPRRWLVIAGAAAVLGTGVLLVTTTGEDGPAATARVLPPAERLVPEPEYMTLRPSTEEGPDRLAIPLFEVLPDGTVSEVPAKQQDGAVLAGVRPMPDGRLLTLASRDLMPGVSRQDGPFVEGVAFPLTVFNADGTSGSDVDIRITGEHASLLAATATEAIVVRTGPAPAGRRIVGRDLATGVERPLRETTLQVTAGDVAQDRVVVAGLDSSGGCRLEVSTVNIEVPACRHVADLNVAPDGRFAAVVYQRLGKQLEVRLRILDLSTAVVYDDELLKPQDPCSSCVVTAHGAGYLGMAWSDPKTLRLAQLDSLPLDFDVDDVLADIADRVHTTTRTLPG